MKAHTRAANCIFNTGEHTNKERTWAAKELRSTTIPVLKFLSKDHKGDQCVELVQPSMGS